MKMILMTFSRSLLALGFAALWLGAFSMQAQAQQFQVRNHETQFFLIGTNGAASIYGLVLNVSSNNVISVNAQESARYDIAPTGSSLVNSNGTKVAKASTPASRVGRPVQTNVTTEVYRDYMNRRLTNTYTEYQAPFAIYLNDGGRIKGAVTRSISSIMRFDEIAKQRVTTEFSSLDFTGGAVHQAKTGFGGTYYGSDAYHFHGGGGGGVVIMPAR
jgi:hypothetical protein